jgi:hypothetical protein
MTVPTRNLERAKSCYANLDTLVCVLSGTKAKAVKIMPDIASRNDQTLHNFNVSITL